MDQGTAPLARWERWHLWCLLGLMVLFGGVIEMRCAFLQRRMSDLTVFLRAGWAVRTGADIYQVGDEANGWFYVYPPIFAIFMTPLAEAPAGADQSGMLPYPVSVAVWFVFNVFVLLWGTNKLAQALETTSADPEIRHQPPHCRRWWSLRLVSIYACLVPIGAALSHAQTNLLILAMLCAMIAAILQKKPFQAGLWMAGPICLKVFPAMLLIYPLWRRDYRCLAGCAAGLFLGTIAIPTAVFGPERTLHYYQEFADLVLMPGIGAGENRARAETLTAITATDTQSFMAMMHNALHPIRLTRPADPAPVVRALHWGLGAVLTMAICLAAGWSGRRTPLSESLFLGLIIMLMMFLSPVCHLHYFAWMLPVVMALLLLQWEHRPTLALSLGVIGLLVLNNVTHVFAHMHENFPIFQIWRDLGLTTLVGMAFMVIGLICLRRQTRTGEVSLETPFATAGAEQIRPAA